MEFFTHLWSSTRTNVKTKILKNKKTLKIKNIID